MANGVKDGTVVLSNGMALTVYYRAGFGANILLKKFFDSDFANETDALAVFFGCSWQGKFNGPGTDFVFASKSPIGKRDRNRASSVTRYRK